MIIVLLSLSYHSQALEPSLTDYSTVSSRLIASLPEAPRKHIAMSDSAKRQSHRGTVHSGQGLR